MKQSEAIVTRQKFKTRFKNEDMDFMFNWSMGVALILGLSPSQVFYAVHGIRDGDPDGWRAGFTQQGDHQLQQSEKYAKSHTEAAGQAYLGAAYAYRAAIQYCSPATEEFGVLIRKMEDAFQSGVEVLGVPIRSIEVPFENALLPGYYLEQPGNEHPILLMVGGADTFREDLFYFAGYPGWKRGCNVLMVDLPGQGKTPERGLCFQVNMEKPISAILDWLEANSIEKPKKIAAYGVSGGGYFTALGAATDKRIRAWIASTPIYDIALTFQRSFGNAVKTPGWLLNLWIKLTATFNRSAEINLAKYAWQFGLNDFKTVFKRVLAEAKAVDYNAIKCPCLFLVGENEDSELKRQSEFLRSELENQGVPVELIEFTAAEGADAHCQLNNLRLTHTILFDWIDKVFREM